MIPDKKADVAGEGNPESQGSVRSDGQGAVELTWSDNNGWDSDDSSVDETTSAVLVDE
jgi:hypothetical protein